MWLYVETWKGRIYAPGYVKAIEEKKAVTGAELAKSDYELYQALNLLKGIRILNPNKSAKAEGSDQ